MRPALRSTLTLCVAAAMVAPCTGCPPTDPSGEDASIDASMGRDAEPDDAADARAPDVPDAGPPDVEPDAGPPDAPSVPDACPSPTTLCGALCADLSADPDHCGGCDMPCVPRAGSIPFCASSRCVNAVCRPGFGNCDADRNNGCEVAVDTSAEHCGLCGHACPAAPHAIPGCADSLCTLECEPGWLDCEPATAGCECAQPDAG